MKILFATPEVHPLVKTGGLADVSAALPAALGRQGADVRVLLPGYPAVMRQLAEKWVVAHGLLDLGEVRLLSARTAQGLALLVLDCPPLYHREGGPYQDRHGHDWHDNALRFGLLSRVAAILAGPASPIDWRPDILHCNDWQTGLAPAWLHFAAAPRAASLMTIHNLAYQGVFGLDLGHKLGLPAASLGTEGVEYYGHLAFLKAGLYYADRLTTVSPTYAREIRTDALGFGMQGVLEKRAGVLTGILNGIDTEVWNPATDTYLPVPFDASHLDAKVLDKRALQARLGLDVRADVPLFAAVSRLAHQKGLDMVLEIAAGLLAAPAQLVLLGSGDKGLEQGFLDLAARHPGQAAVHIGYDEGLAHLVEAGADVFLMPSRFEPCGLNQMYSMRYGTPPVVFATGGLADTVVDASAENLAAGRATGFVFHEPNAAGLLAAIRRALALWQDAKAWKKLQRAGMQADFSWERSARAYLALYEDMLKNR